MCWRSPAGVPGGFYPYLIAGLVVFALKPDKSFVLHAATDAKDVATVTSTVQLTRALGLRMVGEGVEDEHVAALLFAAGVDRVQRWHYSRARPAADLHDWCTERRDQIRGVEFAQEGAAATLGAVI